MVLYIRMIAVLFTSLLLSSVCSGASKDKHKLKRNPTQAVLNKIILYAETEGASSAPCIEDYTLVDLVGVTSENLTLLNQKISKSDLGDTDSPCKIELILDNQDFDGDGVKDKLKNYPLIANTVQADSDDNSFGNVRNTREPVVELDNTELSVGLTIKNSIDLIWEDMNGQNTGYVSNMPNGFKQFRGPTRWNLNDRPDDYADIANAWFEVEAAGDGSNCSLDINRATNTRVEIGWTRMYYLRNDDTWVLASETIDQIQPTGDGGQYPLGSLTIPLPFDRCNPYTNVFKDIRQANFNAGLNIFTKTAGQFTTVKPEFYWRYHAWTAGVRIDLSQIKGLFAQTYMRLIVENPALPDDRHLASYVGHLGSDFYDKSSGTQLYKSDQGISRYKKININWQPINFYNGPWKTKAEFAATNPPFWSTP